MPDDGGRRSILRLLDRFEVPRGGVLMVHSAFRQFSRDGYRAEAVLDALIEYMAPGTLLLPTMSWRYVKPNAPFFDELETPSNVGVMTNLFRTRHAQRRSLHPTHSCAALGPAADRLLDGHHLDPTPCSANSPFGRLLEFECRILMLGISMDCCTLIHHVEEIEAIDEYLRLVSETEHYTCRSRDGEEVAVALRRHFLLPRDYWQYQDSLAAKGLMKTGALDGSIVRCFDAGDMAAEVTASLRQNPRAIIAKPGGRFRMM